MFGSAHLVSNGAYVRRLSWFAYVTFKLTIHMMEELGGYGFKLT